MILAALVAAASSFGTPPAERAPTTTVVEDDVFNVDVGALILSGGLWALTDPKFNQGSYYVDASTEKYGAQAPKAFALREATNLAGSCSGHTQSAKEETPVGLTCSAYFVVDRIDLARVDLLLTFEYVAYRWKPEQRDYAPREEDQCLTKRVVRVSLEGMPDAKPRRVADIARARKD